MMKKQQSSLASRTIFTTRVSYRRPGSRRAEYRDNQASASGIIHDDHLKHHVQGQAGLFSAWMIYVAVPGFFQG